MVEHTLLTQSLCTDYICVQCTVLLVSQLIQIILLYEETHQEAL